MEENDQSKELGNIVKDVPHQEPQKMNPLLSVWFHPKETTRYVITHKNIWYAILLISIGSIGSLLAGTSDSGFSPSYSIGLILALVIIFSPIFGIIYTTIFAGAIFLTSKLFKGIGSFKDIFKTISLINIPAMILIPFYLIWLLSNPDSFFTPDSEPFNLIGFLAIFVSFVVAIWSIVILIAGVAEVHKISNWNAFFILLILSILGIIIIFGLTLIIIILLFIFGLSLV